MTTPTAFQEASRIIKYAYIDAGLVAKNTSPSSSQYAEGMNRLNDIINLWQTQGLKLFLIVDTPITLVANQGTYTVFPGGDVNMTKPLQVVQAYFQDTNAIRRPLTQISMEEWVRLSQTTTAGQIVSLWVDKQPTKLNVHLWNPPDTSAALGTVHLMLRTQVTNIVGLTDTMTFPLEWAIALRWALADDLTTGQPQEIVDRCEKRAFAFREALENWDVEDASVTFIPDARGLQPSSFT